jgi:ATP-dependent Zn protease
MTKRKRIAIHEAGHAVLGAALNETPHHVSIRDAEGTLGRTGQKRTASAASLAQVYLAGFAAEHIATGKRPRSYVIETGLGILAHTDSDLVETIEGVEASDGYGAVREILRTGVRPVEEDLRRELDRLYEIARESVSAVWPSVKALAEALLVREELDRAGIDEVIRGHDIYTPVLRIQHAH